MAEPNNNPAGQEPTPGAGGELTFTQAEFDALISKEKAMAVAKATKGMPTDEELTAFRTWQQSQQTEQERWNNITKERDTVRTELSAAQKKLEQYRREKFLLSKGVSADDVDYYAFKIGKLVTDTTDFETAAAEYLKDHAPKEPEPGRMRVEMAAPLGGNISTKATTNDAMNAMIRGAFR